MKEYVKIETIYKRDTKTKKLIEGDYCNRTVEFLKDCVWEFTEKVDGTNIRVYWDGHEVTFGGRTDKAEIPSHLLTRLQDLFSGEANAQIFEQLFGEKEVFLFGEGYGPKIQNGEQYIDSVDFILFDVMINGVWLDRAAVNEIAEQFNINSVPVIFEGNLDKGIDYVKQHAKSVVAKNGAYMEGLVARPKMEVLDKIGRRLIVKIKYKDFF